jgi:hypothetical protein
MFDQSLFPVHESPILYASLYDVLRHPPGKELGLKVYQKALSHAVTITSREVNTRRYSGEIRLYPEPWLRMVLPTLGIVLPEPALVL